jgi:hypothetical protein
VRENHKMALMALVNCTEVLSVVDYVLHSHHFRKKLGSLQTFWNNDIWHWKSRNVTYHSQFLGVVTFVTEILPDT